MQQNLKLPPFGKILLAYQELKISLNHSIYICVGKSAKTQAFALMQEGALASFIERGDDYAKYKWPVADQKIIVLDTGFSSSIALKKFCVHLMSYKPRGVFLYSENFPSEFYYSKNMES